MIVVPTAAHLKAALEPRHKQALRSWFLRLSSVTCAGTGVQCPCCGRRLARFARFHGQHDQCPRCTSLMRHRALLLYLRDVLRVGTAPARVLHVAPSPAIAQWMRSLHGVSYLSTDLCSPLADVQADITDLPFADASFDLVLCAHVLEHVPDDRRAIAEFHRVLAPGGTAVLQVPPDPVAETFEDPAVTDPRDRERLFGQYDHVRRCGPDYGLRIAAAGFEVVREDYAERLEPETRERYGVRTGEPFYVCDKPQGVRAA
jgi:SAM-dependent methyltransferase